MRRLYLKIYLTIIASLVLVVVVAGAVWRWGAGGPPGAQVFEIAGEIASLALPPADAPQSEQQRAIEELAAPLPQRSCALHRAGRADRRGRPAAAAAAARRGRRLDPQPRRAGLGVPAAGRALAGGARAAAPPPSGDRLPAGARRHRAGGGGRRLSVRARADPAARTAAGRRREARRGQPRGARRGRRQGRGGAACRELQPLRRAHRGPDGRAPHAARQRLARAAHAAVAHPALRRADAAGPRPEIQGRRSSATSPSSTR